MSPVAMEAAAVWVPEDVGEASDARVLLVDDSQLALSVVARVLEAWGFVVETALGGVAGTVHFNASAHDVVVCDVAMADMSGLEVLQEIRTRAPTMPVVMLAAYSEMGDVLQAMRSGAFDYIVKDEIHVIREAVRGQKVPEDHPDPLHRAVTRAVEYKRLVESKEALVVELQQSNQQLEQERAELKRTLEELRQTQSQLVAAEKRASLSKLTAGIGNEINNPLAFLMANFGVFETWMESAVEVEAVRSMPLSEEIDDVLDDCRNGLERIQEIVRALQTFSRTRRARMQSVVLPDLFETLSADAVEDLGARCPPQIQCESVPPVRAHGGHLRQALVSVLKNAIEAGDDGAGVTMGARHTDAGVEIAVCDCGQGIPEEDLPNVFDPFFTTKRDQRASGLGLSVAKELVERMGGTLTLQSQEGEGTQVHVVLQPWGR